MFRTKITDTDKWFNERREALVNMKPALRPKNIERPIKSRSPEKSRALGLACKRAWDRAIATGLYVKTERGYRIGTTGCENVMTDIVEAVKEEVTELKDIHSIKNND